jgi:arylsulfatase
MGKGGTGVLWVNNKKVASGRIPKTQGHAFSADEGVDVGEDRETPVVEDYGLAAPYRFSGKIKKVTVELKQITSADKATTDKAQQEAALRRALAN